MQTDHVKIAAMASWILLTVLVGYISGIASLAGWIVLAAVAVTPPVVMMRLWRAPAQSVSESIREAIR